MPSAADERAPQSSSRARIAVLAFLSLLAVYIAVRYGQWWGIALVLVEALRRPLANLWNNGVHLVDRIRLGLAPAKRLPSALIGIPLLFLGLALGIRAPEYVDFIGAGANSTIRFIANSAPYIIFFTLTPALASTLRSGKAGKFALWVNGAYVLSTVLAGLLAVLLVVPIFGVRLLGRGAAGTAAPQTNVAELAFTSPPFLAIFTAVGVGLLIYGFRLRGLEAFTSFVGGKLVELLGDLLKILLPLILFALGVFIPTRVGGALARAREAGDLQGQGWVGGLSVEAAYFATVGVLVVLLAAWVFGFAYLVMRHTRLPFRTFLRDYFADVYPYAWATASSSATIPINLERAASGLRVRRQVRDFVIPLGATVNLDGTMIGGIVTAVAAAQMVGYTPTLVDLFLILVPLSIITIGVPGIPGGLAAVAAPVMTSLLPLPAGTEAAFTAIFIGFNIGLSDQFRTGVNSVDNGILSRLFEHWYPKRFAVDDGDAAGGPEARVAGASP